MLDKWDYRFLNIAHEVSSWSKDPSTKVGALLVVDRRIISSGYNGFPSGFDDDISRYVNRDMKLALTIHAEVNAIINSAKNGSSTKGSTLYVTFPPCVACSTSIVQSGVTRIVCPPVASAPERWADNFTLGRNILLEAGIDITNYDDRP